MSIENFIDSCKKIIDSGIIPAFLAPVAVVLFIIFVLPAIAAAVVPPIIGLIFIYFLMGGFIDTK